MYDVITELDKTRPMNFGLDFPKLINCSPFIHVLNYEKKIKKEKLENKIRSR